MEQGRQSSLILDVRVGETVRISGEATVQMLRKTGKQARIRVTALPEVKIVQIRNRDDEESGNLTSQVALPAPNMVL